jgi:hypothetical protein
MRRYFPQLAANHSAKPPVDELTMSLTDHLAELHPVGGYGKAKQLESFG